VRDIGWTMLMMGSPRFKGPAAPATQLALEIMAS
jgi:hypothetical protein